MSNKKGVPTNTEQQSDNATITMGVNAALPNGGIRSQIVPLMLAEIQDHPGRLVGMGAFWTWLQLVFATYIHAPNTMLGGTNPVAQ